MTEYNKQPESTLRIRFHDCDPFNHLNNSRYIDYMMAARSDHLLEHYNFDMFASAQKDGVSWVFGQTQIAYIFPAFLSEIVLIQTRLISLNEKTILLEAVMYDQHKKKVKSVMWATLIHFDLRSQKSIAHSVQLLEFFSPIVFATDSTISFEQRVKQLKDPP
jgi:YbgC/YbaW family acyl-CoA thioester hydrolase